MEKSKWREIVLGVILNVLVVIVFCLLYYSYIIEPNSYVSSANVYSATLLKAYQNCKCSH